MKLIDNIRLKIIQDNNKQDPISDIIIAEQPTRKKIKAQSLEQRLGWQDGHLLFTTEDVPFEEALTMTLFDKYFNQIDQICIATILTKFTFCVPRLNINELACQHHVKQRIVLNKRQ